MLSLSCTCISSPPLPRPSLPTLSIFNFPHSYNCSLSIAHVLPPPCLQPCQLSTFPTPKTFPSFARVLPSSSLSSSLSLFPHLKMLSLLYVSFFLFLPSLTHVHFQLFPYTDVFKELTHVLFQVHVISLSLFSLPPCLYFPFCIDASKKR